jgi:hypothetical protein
LNPEVEDLRSKEIRIGFQNPVSLLANKRFDTGSLLCYTPWRRYIPGLGPREAGIVPTTVCFRERRCPRKTVQIPMIRKITLTRRIKVVSFAEQQKALGKGVSR